MPPVGAVAVLAQPGQHPRLDRLEPAPPLVAPVVAPHRRHGRQHGHRRHVVVVVDEVDQPQRAAAPVHVVGPPVVAGVDRADRLERRRPLGGDLQRVEAGVRRAPHADVAVAPVLLGQPRDDRDQVGLLGLGVLVRRVAGRRAGAAHVDPADGVPELVAQPDVALGSTTTSGRPCGTAAPPAGTAAARGRRRGGTAWRPARPRPASGSGPRAQSGTRVRQPDQPGHGRGVETLAGVAVAADRGRRQASIELSTASSAASTTASNRSSSVAAGDDRLPSSQAPSRSVRRPVETREEDLAAAVVGDRAGAGQAETDPAGQPGAVGAVDRRVGDHDADARARPAGGSGSACSGQQPPDRYAVDGQPLALAEVGHQQHRRPCARPGVTRDDVPMPPLKPRQDMPVPEPTLPSGGAPRRPREASAAAQARRDVVVLDLHPAAVVEERVVALADDRDDDVVGDLGRPARASISAGGVVHPARAAWSTSGRSASRARPTRRR